MAKTAGAFAGVGRVKQGAELARRTRERFPMKRSWVGVLAAIAVLCLLWSLTVKARMNPGSSFEKHWVARPRESHSPSSGQSLRVLSGGFIRSAAGLQEFFFTPDVLWRAENLDPISSPWLESHGPPGRYRDPGRPCRAVSRDGSPHRDGKLRLRSEFSDGPCPNLKHGVLQHALASHTPSATGIFSSSKRVPGSTRARNPLIETG